MVMKKHIVHKFSFYIHKKINIQKTHKMKKKTKYQTEWMRIERIESDEKLKMRKNKKYQ